MVRSLITVSFIHRGSLLWNHDGANVNTVTCTDSSGVCFFTVVMETTALTQGWDLSDVHLPSKARPLQEGHH